MLQENNHTFFERFLHSQTSGSIVLIIATVIAVFWANSPWSKLYFDLCHLNIGVVIAEKTYKMGLAHWIKDGLMTLFFFVVGLEIKREVLLGELSSFKKASLPVLAAIGGCVTPALIYFFFNPSGPTASGWGIPMATDIAFAIGILSLLGDKVPTGLKIFLTALAIVDDLIAVLVIAIFYTEDINLISLLIASGFLFLFYVAVKLNARRPLFFLFPALGVWISFMFSGIHATVAGVLIALLVPIRPRIEPSEFFQALKNYYISLKDMGEITKETLATNKNQWLLVEKIYLTVEDMIPSGVYLEKHFHPVQAFVILPLFALFSAGVTITATMISHFPGDISLGIIGGLVIGKPIGIIFFSWLAIFIKIADMPEGVRWSYIFGAGLLAGIGFTMSIFISELGFKDLALIDEAKLSIFIASFLAGILGFLFLRFSLNKRYEN